MGKETEIFQAAQEGNLTKLESIFSQKGSKVFAGLFKGPNVNFRDDSGCTALHLAALYGHKDIVIFLLHNDASANMPDNAGSYPLHLAAFNGHYEVAKILLMRGPSRADVNETNVAGDTALHVAAQYGHRHVAQVLLEQHAEPRLRNTKQESPLDLAAQYGRLSTVQLFLFFEKSILQDAVHKHSPLHLASRNGHKDVVMLLLDNGMPVNATCDMGTALHCAALYGKVDVAKLLLDKGIDINIEDGNGQKVLDLLCSHPSQRSQEITALIYEKTARRGGTDKPRVTATSYSGQQFEIVETKRHNTVAASQNIGRYDFVPPPRPKEEAEADSYRPYSLLQSNDKKSRLSDHEDNFDLAMATPLDNSGHHKGFFKAHHSEQDTEKPYCLVGDVDTKENIAIKQFRTQSFNKTLEEDSYVHIKQDFSSKPLTSKSNYNFQNSNDNASQQSQQGVYQIPPPFKPLPQNDIYQYPSSFPDSNMSQETQQNSNGNHSDSYDNHSIKNVRHSMDDVYFNVNITNKPAVVENTANKPSLVENTANKPSLVENTANMSAVVENTANMSAVLENVSSNQVAENPTNNLVAENQTSLSYDNVNITNKPDCLKDDSDSYYQDPTSITSQVNTIKDAKNFKTKSVKQKRTGGNIRRNVSLDSIDESSLSQPDNSNDSNNNYDIVPSIQQRSLCTTSADTSNLPVDNRSANIVDPENVESSLSTQKSHESDINKTKENIKTEPTQSTNIKTEQSRQIEEDDSFETNKPIKKPPRTKIKQQRTVAQVEDRSVSSGYRMSIITRDKPLDETYEWNKIDDFLSDLTEFAKTEGGVKSEGTIAASKEIEANKKPVVKSVTNIVDVSTWLESLKLSQYEPAFLANGFDDLQYLNGVLEDQDLVELGILDVGHRNKILQSSYGLAKVSVVGDDDFPIPSTIGEWLSKLRLQGYEIRFKQNGYDNMDRVRVIWELELVTVIDIATLGHRKRMMYSLGRRPPDVKGKVSWAKRFAEADVGKKKPEKVADDSMAIAQKLLKTADNLTSSTVVKTPSKEKSSRKPSVSLDSSSDSSTGSRSSQPPSNPQSPTEDVAKRKTNIWKHEHHVLLFNCVSYTVQYLGSHPVQQVKGVESTLEACNKMRSISRNVHKMPHIILSISVRGIDYIDSNSKMVINQYDMNHISFCTEDPKDLQVFAYITRDELTRKNYCHVFKAESRGLADEIILTIGQCFELAYEQYKAMTNYKQNSSQQSQEKGPPPLPRPYSERKNN